MTPPAVVWLVQVDELQELSLLARDAAEILWEMVAMGEGGAAVEDMKSKAYQLQAQLRGLIGDYQVGLARALTHCSWLGTWPGLRGAYGVVCGGGEVKGGERPAGRPWCILFIITAWALLVADAAWCAYPSAVLQGGDEGIFAKAFESFDMLSRCLEEQSAPAPGPVPAAGLAAPPAALGPASLAPPPLQPAAVNRPTGDEAPLISFD